MSASLELPVGVYRVSTKRTFDNYRFVRSAFEVRNKKVIKINVFPPFRVLEIATGVDENGFRDKYILGKEPQYQTFSVPRNKNKSLKLVVRYDYKKQMGKIITFTGEDLNVMASYDCFSIYANNLRINTATLEIEAFGDVFLEDDLNRQKANTAKVFFEGGELKFR